MLDMRVNNGTFQSCVAQLPFSHFPSVQPAFHFCVGFALRLVLIRRLNDRFKEGATWWGARGSVFAKLFKTRVMGLIILSMFFSVSEKCSRMWRRGAVFARAYPYSIADADDSSTPPVLCIIIVVLK